MAHRRKDGAAIVMGEESEEHVGDGNKSDESTDDRDEAAVRVPRCHVVRARETITRAIKIVLVRCQVAQGYCEQRDKGGEKAPSSIRTASVAQIASLTVRGPTNHEALFVIPARTAGDRVGRRAGLQESFRKRR